MWLYKSLGALLDRPGLCKILDEGANGDLTIIQAPAGFGKTTLLAQWRRLREAAGDIVVWIELTKAAQDGEEFVAAVQAGLRSALATSQQEPVENEPIKVGFGRGGAALKASLKDLGASPSCYFLVLDDYENAQSPDTEKIIEKFLDIKPENLHLTIISQIRPRLNLSDLRLLGRVRQIGEDNLRFSRAEVERLFDRKLTAQSVTFLHERSEGWPALLQLAILWVNQGVGKNDRLEHLTGEQSPISDYFMEKIYQELPPELREFLLNICVLRSLNPNLAEALHRGRNTMAFLQSLENSGLISRPDQQDKSSLALNPLFREFLHAQLLHENPEQAYVLKRKAAEVLASSGQYTLAIEYAIDANDEELAVRILEESDALQRYVSEGLSGLRRSIALISPAARKKRPRLQLIEIILKLKDGLILEGQRQFEELKLKTNDFTTVPDDTIVTKLSADADLVSLLLRLYGGGGCTDAQIKHYEETFSGKSVTFPYLHALVQAYISLLFQQRGSLDQAERAYRRLENLVSSLDTGWWTMWLLHHAAIIDLARGSLREAESKLTRALRHSRTFPDSHSQFEALVGALLAEIRYELGDMGKAEHTLTSALSVIEEAEGWFDHYAASYITAARLMFRNQGLSAALSLCDQAHQISKQRGMNCLDVLIPSLRVDLLVRANYTEEARALVDEHKLDVKWNDDRAIEEINWREYDILGMALARLLEAEGNFTVAHHTILKVRRRAEQEGRRLSLVRALTFEAVLLWRNGKVNEARVRFNEAITYGQADELTGPFIDSGPEIVDLISAMLTNETISREDSFQKYLRTLFQLLRTSNSERSGDSGLTLREIEVLAHLSRGVSNKVIAQNLGLTERTVKFHLSNIYAKLGVGSRTAALAAARTKAYLT